MIYTIGHKGNYMAAIAERGTILKTGRRDPCEVFPDGYPGGYAFLTFEDAFRRIKEEDQPEWIVFGLDATWGIDTAPATDGWWYNLIFDAVIIVLGDGEQRDLNP